MLRPELTRWQKIGLVVVALAATLGAGTVFAQQRTMSIATGGTGGVYYPLGGGMANVLSKTIPGIQATAEVTGGSVDNLKLINAGRAEIALSMVDAALDAYKGQDKFKGTEVPVRTLMVLYPNQMHVVTIEGTGIEKMADLKGKRVSWTVGSPALNHNIASVLAFAGLTWKDVKKVEVPGFAAGWDAIVNGQSDAAFSSTVSGVPKKLEASPRGLYWVPMPHGDKAGWARLKKMAPYMAPHLGTIGSGGVSKENPHQGAAYPYPVLICNADEDGELVYNLAKALDIYYDDYKDGSPGIGGWALSKQVFDWAVPFHDGAIKYFKEKGVWTEAHQKHNDGLVKRQEVLASAWKATKAKKIEDSAKFSEAWMSARAAALEKAGMDAVF